MNNKKIVIITMVVLFLLLVIPPTKSIQIKQTTISTNDIATWYINDYWTYDIDPLIFSSPNGSFTGTITNLKQQVTDITTINHYGTNIDAYELTITGNINGDLTYEFITGDLQGTITGTSYVRQADLAELSTTITSTGTITVIIIQQPYFFTTENNFLPTFELYDFPINVNEEWNTTSFTSTTGYFEIGDLINDTINNAGWINETISCTTQETITVPAGTFSTYKINHGSTDAWYAPTIGNMIKTHISQTTNTTTIQMTLNLIDYQITTPETTITTEITPTPAILNYPVTISGEVTDTDTGQPIQAADIILTIPYTSDQYTTTTNTNGEYTITFNTPFITDNTPTTNDLGSDGMHIHCSKTDEINTYIISTLIVRDNTAPTDPTITGKTNGQANTEYTYTFQSSDLENDPIYLMVDWGDSTQTDWLGPYNSVELINLEHTWTQKDSYTIRAKTKDMYELESDWSTLDIQMPQMQLHQRPFHYILYRINLWIQQLNIKISNLGLTI
jgi:hypothetical protein